MPCVTRDCRNTVEFRTFCSVEGRDTEMCRSCRVEWVNLAAGDDRLAAHCPRCAPAYIARRDAQAYNPNVDIADDPITGPLAIAIDDAMRAEGVLKPSRDRVLRRLAANNDAYVSAVLARMADRVA